MRTNTELPFQVVRVRHKPHDFKAPVVQSEKSAYCHVVDAGIHRTVHGVKPPAVIALDGIAGMQFGITSVVVGLLEYLECPDSGTPKFAQILYAHGCRIDIDAANGIEAFP